MAQTGRNDPCTCGKTGPDGKRPKYKRCCGSIDKLNAATDQQPRIRAATPEQQRRAQEAFQAMQAKERIRRNQQGGGKPIIAAEFAGHQVVAVGNNIFTVPQGKTFSDFLFRYLSTTLGKEWGDAELKKPLGERHPLMQWYDEVVRFQQENTKPDRQVQTAEMNGAVAAYLGLAYNFYRLEHNAEIQKRLIHRLKIPDQFQGAYYELMVSSILIDADFELELENEEIGGNKHCEFSARSKRTGKKYWVEAKMRSVSGLMGKTDADGAKPDAEHATRTVSLVAQALQKPAADERFVFVDLNVDLAPDIGPNKKPTIFDPVIKKLNKYEHDNMPDGMAAYVFLTASSFHRDLRGPPRMVGYMHGLGIDEFNDIGPMRPAELYRKERPHIDAITVGKTIMRYLVIPTTLDGSMPSEKFGDRARPQIGGQYKFKSETEELTGNVLTARVDEDARKMILEVVATNGERVSIHNDMSDDEMRDYKQNRQDYFGPHAPQRTVVRTAQEIFDWAMTANANTPRELLLNAMKAMPNIEEIGSMSDDDVRAEHAEWVTRIMVTRTEQARKAKAGK